MGAGLPWWLLVRARAPALLVRGLGPSLVLVLALLVLDRPLILGLLRTFSLVSVAPRPDGDKKHCMAISILWW